MSFVHARKEDEHGALESGWVLFVHGMKDEHGALDLGWFWLAQGTKDEHGALERPGNEG